MCELTVVTPCRRPSFHSARVPRRRRSHECLPTGIRPRQLALHQASISGNATTGYHMPWGFHVNEPALSLPWFSRHICMLGNSEPSADCPTVSCQCCGRQAGGNVSAWALGRAFRKRGLLRWTLKGKFKSHYRQEFHTVLLGPCSLPFWRSRPGSASLCTGWGLPLPGCPAGSLEHCHRDSGSGSAPLLQSPWLPCPPGPHHLQSLARVQGAFSVQGPHQAHSPFLTAV